MSKTHTGLKIAPCLMMAPSFVVHLEYGATKLVYQAQISDTALRTISFGASASVDRSEGRLSFDIWLHRLVQAELSPYQMQQTLF